VHWQGDCWHFGHLKLYLFIAAFSRSIPVRFANDESHAITSANSFSVASLLLPLSSSPSSWTSSTSQSYVPLIPRSASFLKNSCLIISWKSCMCTDLASFTVTSDAANFKGSCVAEALGFVVVPWRNIN